MDCSIARQSRFPFFFPIWSSSSKRSQPESAVSASTQTQTPTVQTVPKMGITSTLQRRSTERERSSRDAARKDVTDGMERLVGLDNVKRQLNGVQSYVQICRRHGRDPRSEWYNIAMQGNPGTGKSIVARIYAKMLYSIGITDAETVKETSGSELASKGSEGTQRLIQDIVDAAPSTQTAGVMIVDNPQTLDNSTDSASAEQTLSCMVEAMERPTNRIVVVFTGYPEHIAAFLRDHPRIQRLTCSTLNFADFERHDLLQLLGRRITGEYQGRMQVEGGLEGPYMQVAARRLARGRGKKGFTNAHAVRDLVAHVARRQAQYLTDQTDGMDEVDYFFFSRQDLLGPSPADIRMQSEAWQQLQGLVGQEAVKASVREVFDTLEENYTRELRNQRRLPVRLNRVFTGPQGTGKSTAAKLYMQVLADLGLLNDGEGILSAFGFHENKLTTTAPVKSLFALDNTPSDTLIIEVDSLDGTTVAIPPRYPQDVLDTLTTELTKPRVCTVLIGSTSAVESLLSQLSKSTVGKFEGQVVQFNRLTREQMEQLFQSKVEDNDIDSTPEAFQAAMDILDNARMRRDFDNARAIERLVAVANHNFEDRRARSSEPVERVLQAEDFQPDLVGGHTTLAFRDELRYSIVPDDIISVLKRYHNEMKAAWMQGVEPSARIPYALVFKGAPGTGKRTVAQHLAILYYKMGVLETSDLVECSISDLVHFVGQSPRARSQLDLSRGKVLFIEDAHRLGDSETTLRAMDELVYMLPKHAGQTVVILAGPAAEMDHLLANRPRLASLFQEEIAFRNPTPRECLRLLDRKLDEQGVRGPRTFLTDPKDPTHREFTRAVQILSMFPCWSNERDMDVLVRWMVSACIKDVPLENSNEKSSSNAASVKLVLADEQAMSCMIRLFNLKRDRLRFNQDPKARTLPRILSQPRSTERGGVRFPV
ncbi:protein GbpA [Aspergillus affinis]|uniref:protein GbpA n=1 Tax=Aspergillus affinis TaxID=1070780 RepID=UPI0022FF34DE|nr:uncharacterized protein KD926_005917 [Aspergillus affinis]KAI9045973.1 hypothetical protein KD926_005917 [Aspergillus affinis]